MKRLIESITGGYASSAKVVDGTLILSLPDAISPVVWRMDLGSVRSSALEVREQKEGGPFVLTLKTPRDDVHDIAPFATRAQAVKALMAVSRALENSHGQRPQAQAAAETSYAPRRSTGKWVASLLAVLVVLFIVNVALHKAPQQGSFDNTSSASASSTSGGDVNAPGVPVSADDFLRQNTATKQP